MTVLLRGCGCVKRQLWRSVCRRDDTYVLRKVSFKHSRSSSEDSAPTPCKPATMQLPHFNSFRTKYQVRKICMYYTYTAGGIITGMHPYGPVCNTWMEPFAMQLSINHALPPLRVAGGEGDGISAPN